MSGTENPNEKNKSVFKEWLEKLQQESWQLELLISGLALFGIWESRTTLLKFDYYVETNVVDPYIFYGTALVFVLWSGWSIFLINLLIHIILRGLWIGAIGLRYVSGDIDFDELNYSDTFKNYFKRRIGSFDDYIERLERLSSVIFSFTFLLFFLFFSFVLVNLVFGIIVSTGNNIFYPDAQGPNPFVLIFGGLFYGLGLLVLIDFFTLGGFKKVKDPTFSIIYLWLYRFFSTISLSFIYRPLLLNFIDNKYTRRLFYMALPYTLILIFGFSQLSLEKHSFIPPFSGDSRYYQFIDKYAINWNNYDDLRTEYHSTFSNLDRPEIKSSISIASLNAYELSENYGKLFLKYLRNDNQLISRQNPDISAFKKAGLRHRLFSAGRLEDPALEHYIENQTKETRVMLHIVREEQDEIDSTDRIDFAKEIEYFKDFNAESIPELRKEIENKYDLRKRNFADQKLQKALNAILSNYKVRIDDVLFTDSLECSFYTHPNRHAQGLLCYFPIKNLKEGAHLIEIKKNRNNGDCIDDCPELEKFLPFRKI